MANLIDREEIDAVIACLGDDAAQLREDNPDDERADNMDRAATLLQQLADDNSAIARILLDQDREAAKGWARGLHINMDGEGGLTATADTADATGVPAGDPSDKLRRCSLGCLEYGECKAAAHGCPSECPSGVEGKT